MKRCIATFLLSLLLLFAASAQSAPVDTPSSREDVIRLFDVMQIRPQMEQVMKQMFQQMRAMSREEMKDKKSNVRPEDMAKADALANKIMNEISVSDIIDDMIPVYQNHLSKTDVDEMIKFYSTPTGQKILREMPAMTAEGMQAMQPRLKKQMDQISREIDEMVKEEQAKPKPASPAKPQVKANQS
jgi:uncharacterized protein